ncbi:MAG: hypothetical protein ABI824_16755 [Acidobacteriota bacterium]
MRFLRIAALSALAWTACLQAETMLEHSAEVRFQLDLKVPEAALAALLPQGWTPNIATTGAAKDCNVRAIFIDRVTINDPMGAPKGKGSNRLAYLVAPVKSPTGENVQMVIAGLTEDPADAPGPFGNYLLATTHSVNRTSTAATGPIIDTQDWVFTAATGEHLELHIKFERGNANKRNNADTKFYSAKNPSFFQISRQEQVLDILRNTTTTPPDHVRKFSFKCSGGSYAKLCDGTEKVLSWDNVLWLNRTVLLP